MAKVTQVDFLPREIVSYTKGTQTPVVTPEKEGESFFTFDRRASPEPDDNVVFSTAEEKAGHYDEGRRGKGGIGGLSGRSRVSFEHTGCSCDQLYPRCNWHVALHLQLDDPLVCTCAARFTQPAL